MHTYVPGGEGHYSLTDADQFWTKSASAENPGF